MNKAERSAATEAMARCWCGNVAKLGTDRCGRHERKEDHTRVAETPDEVIDRFFKPENTQYLAFHENAFADNTMSKGVFRTFLREYADAILRSAEVKAS